MPANVVSLQAHKAQKQAAIAQKAVADVSGCLLGREAVHGAAADLACHFAALALDGRSHDALLGIEAMQRLLTQVKGNVERGQDSCLLHIVQHLHGTIDGQEVVQ